MQVIPWRSKAKIRSSLQTVRSWSRLAARHPASHSCFFSSTAWRQNKVEKLMDHAGVARAAKEILFHHMAFMGYRVVHAGVSGAPPLPIPSGSSQSFVTPCPLLSVQCFAFPQAHFPRGAALALPCPWLTSPHLLWAGLCTPGHTHLLHKPRQKNPQHPTEKIPLLSLFPGVKFKNIPTSQFCLNWLCHCHFQPRAAAKCSACFCWCP